MTADTLCGYPNRDEALISYLYDDLDEAARSAFDTHLVLCARCRLEAEQLSSVRTHLSAWQPYAVVSHQSSVVSPQSSVISPQSSVISPQSSVGPQSSVAGPSRRSWREIPAWAQVAAALLCLGVGAGLANLDIRYDRQGLSIHTGWLKSAATLTSSVAPASVAGGATSGAGQGGGPDAAPPWRADLTALEHQLRTEFQSASAPAPAGLMLTRATQPSLSDAELLKRMRALVEESERRQNRELALRVGEMARGVNAQRNADLRKIDQSLGLIQSNTGVEVLKQRQLLNYLVRVSAQK
jgi:hypothetical protein